jgi:DtxR family Mn-dependent transcriptional regulator
MTTPLVSLLIAAALTALGLWLFWPESGLFWRWQRSRQMTERVLREDALKHICQSELDGEKPTAASLAGALEVSGGEAARVVADLQGRELLELRGSDLHLTAAGRDYALRIIRAHRLYERYLAEESGYAEAEWHTRAHEREHQLSSEEVTALAARLGNPAYDPHGDPIPTADGLIHTAENAIPLASLEPGKPARIAHLEDEPETIYAQLVAVGLHVGQEVRLLEATPQRIRFWAAGDEHVLAPILAASVSVIPMPEIVTETPPGEPLTMLKPGQEAQVVHLSPRIRGVERRRLMDLGLLPGSTIAAEMTSASGDPTAYRVRGALIALRKNQTDQIYVCPNVSN